MGDPAPILLPIAPSYEEGVRQLAEELTALRAARNMAADAKNWEMAQLYVSRFNQLAEAKWGRVPSGREDNQFSRIINKDIRSQPGYEGPGGSWLSDARRLHNACPEVFRAGTKHSTYDNYRQVFTSSLPAEKKKELRRFLEKDQPTRKELRQRIREEVDAQKGITRPDFDLKVGNSWKFSKQNRPEEFDGGIHPDLVANLLYYFTDPGHIVLDPMAGGDTTYRVCQGKAFFRKQQDSLPFSGPRKVVRFDLNPQSRGIQKIDLREEIPGGEGWADFCLFDPPYYRTAAGKYASHSKTIADWLAFLAAALGNCAFALKPSGRIAIILDDYLRADEFQPLAGYAFKAALDLGLEPVATVYNFNPHFVVSAGPLEMARAKKARLLMNQAKIIHVFERQWS